MKKLIITLALVSSALACFAQDDSGVWTSAIVKKKFTPHFGGSLYGEVRTLDFASTFDMYIALAGVDFYINSWLNAEAAYIFINKFKPAQYNANLDTDYEKYWIPMNRFHTNATAKYRLGNWTFYLREQYQITHYDEQTVDGTVRTTGEGVNKVVKASTTQQLRSRAKIAYSVKRFVPNTSLEVYNDFDNFAELNKLRFTIGSEYKITTSQTIELFYRLQQKRVPTIANQHILGIGYRLII